MVPVLKSVFRRMIFLLFFLNKHTEKNYCVIQERRSIVLGYEYRCTMYLSMLRPEDISGQLSGIVHHFCFVYALSQSLSLIRNSSNRLVRLAGIFITSSVMQLDYNLVYYVDSKNSIKLQCLQGKLFYQLPSPKNRHLSI